MANSTPSNPAYKASGAPGNLDMLLDLFAGEVLSKYEARTVMGPLHNTITLEGGKSKKYPIIGSATGGYHVPGTEIVGDQIDQDERIVTADDKLIASVFISDIQEKLNHYDIRSKYADKLATFLQRHYDANVMRAVITAARDAGKLADGGGSFVTNAALLTDVTKLWDAFSQAREAMDVKNVDVDSKQVNGLVSTAQFYALARTERNRNRDYNASADVAQQSLTTIDGVRIFKSNIGPFGKNETALTSIPARYRGDFTKSVGIVWTADAVVTASVQELTMQTEEQIRKQGTLVLAGQMVGTNVLSANDAVELRTGA